VIFLTTSCGGGGDGGGDSTSAVSSGFTIITIDSSGDVGTDTSIAIDSNNNIHISYYDDYPNYNLKYATCSFNCTTPFNWTFITVDSSIDDVGWYTSIAVDSTDNVCISYYDYTNTALKYITKVSGSWSIPEIVDNLGDVGWYTSITIDSLDIIHISYYDNTTYDLKYATCSSNCTNQNNWSIEVVDSAGDVGEYSSIAIDSNDNVHISYYDSDNGNLKYATNVSGPWVTSTIDKSADVGLYTSIAIDTNNKVHISYYDWDNGNLKYAVK
jgi:hypothetical protein